MSAALIPWGYLYETTNLVNGMLYIGIKRLPKFKKSYLGSGLYLQRAVKKYGRKAFRARLLAWAYSKEELSKMEQRVIAEYRANYGREALYNLAGGGYTGIVASAETRKRMSDAWVGRVISEETKKRMSESRKGLKFSDAHKAALGATRKGPKHPLFGKPISVAHRAAVSKRFKGGKLTPEHRALIGLANSRRVVKESTKEKIRAARLGVKASDATRAKMRRVAAWRRMDNHPHNIANIEILGGML